MIDRRRFLWLAAAGAGSLLLRTARGAPVRVCGACGHEALHEGAQCLHCGAALPPLPDAAPVEPAPEPAPAPVNGRVRPDPADLVPAGAGAQELRWAVQLREQRGDWVTLFAARNAAAFAALEGREGAPVLAASAALVQECRRGLFTGSRICPVCDGSGKRRIQIVTLKGEVVEQELPALACASCRGNGRWPARPMPDEIARDEAAARRAYAIDQLRRGRVESAGLWLPRDLEGKLDPRSTAALRKAFGLPCPTCHGFGALGCANCQGAGRVRCTNADCRNGTELCPDCRGTGRSRAAGSGTGGVLKRCDTCRGAGKRDCPVCGGAGHLDCPTCEARGETLCTACRGAGEPAECARCAGQGFNVCTRCGGTGEARNQPCAACGGVGATLCATCQGFGRSARRR